MRKRYGITLSMLSGVMLCVCFFSSTALAILRGGCAKVNITPPVGIWLSGYPRDRSSDDIADELFARALVLGNENDTIAIVSADLLWVTMEITEEIRKQVKEKIGIEEKNILVCATHTHFGPRLSSKTKMGPESPENTVDEAYIKTLVKKMSSAIVIAYKNRQDIKVGAVKGRIPEIVFNRRPKKPDGSLVMTFSISDTVASTRQIRQDSCGSTRVTFSPEPNEPPLTFGPVDPDAWILRIEDMEGRIVGSLVNYACHAVSGSTFPDWFYSISADYPGAMMRIVEQIEGGICLFTSGTAGDIVPLSRGQRPRFQIGKALAGEVIRRLQFVPTSSEIDIKAMTAPIELPIKQDLSLDRISDTGKEKDYLVTEIQILKIGEFYVLGLPGEILVEVGLEIKQKAGLKNLIIVSLSNDTIGYVCHNQAYDEGGYEPDLGTNLAKGAGEIIIKQALKLISRIQS
ncbi:MAG: neutral/alkaline non-lysosomal ceramidase N-terminal domain-containing protein [Sedimentisphaerales bacterium]|nr:neutral/alkaline non-lysosomal ceramidase N-terminal domain-containing protein [Sedimentisphaerales bacterium]